jgi:hypothetical protein
LDQLAEEGTDEVRSGQAVPHPQPRSSEGSAAPTTAAAASGDDSPKGAGGCAPPPPSLRTTGVGRRGGEAQCARRVPQRSPGSQVRAWAGGGVDEHHGFLGSADFGAVFPLTSYLSLS